MGLSIDLDSNPTTHSPFDPVRVLLSEKNLRAEGGRTAQPDFRVGAEILLLRGRTTSEKIDGVLCASLQEVYPLGGASAHR